jgi:hypothetical protein
MDPIEAVMTVAVAVAGVAANGGQLRRLRRHGNAGVSAWTWTLIATGGFAWAVDLAMRGLWATAGIDLVLGSIAAVVALRAEGARIGRQATVAAAVVAAVALAGSVSLAWAAVVVGVVTVAMYTPQFVSGVRRAGGGASLEGVSVQTWVLNAGISMLWLGWSLASDVPHGVIANLILAAMAVTVAVVTARAQRGRATLAVGGEAA